MSANRGKKRTAAIEGLRANKAELGKILGRGPSTIDQWIARGMPYEAGGGIGKPYVFDVPKVIDWVVNERERQCREMFARNPSAFIDTKSVAKATGADLVLNDERARQAKEQADKIALDNAKARGELISIDSVVDHWGRMILSAKRHLRGIPTRAKTSGILPGLTMEQGAKLGDLIDASLRELAGTGIPTPPNPDDGEAVEAEKDPRRKSI